MGNPRKWASLGVPGGRTVERHKERWEGPHVEAPGCWPATLPNTFSEGQDRAGGRGGLPPTLRAVLEHGVG